VLIKKQSPKGVEAVKTGEVYKDSRLVL